MNCAEPGTIENKNYVCWPSAILMWFHPKRKFLYWNAAIGELYIKAPWIELAPYNDPISIIVW